jgi:hypothetical protein
VYVLDGENVLHELRDDLIKKIDEVKHQLRDIPSGNHIFEKKMSDSDSISL